jgi:hypothetical protein
MGSRLVSLIVAGSSSAWEAVGFATDEAGRIAFANGALEFDGDTSRRPAPVALRVAGVEADSLSGIALVSGSPVPSIEHPNGCFELDHLVIVTPELERTSEAVEATLGLPQRRMRETSSARQAFHRFDERGCIVELVESDRVPEPTLFGIVANTPELEALAAELGEDVIGAPKPAVQPGRLIATFRKHAGLGFPVALMTPDD